MVNTNQMLLKIKDVLEQTLKEEFGNVPISIETTENSCSYTRECAIRFSVPITVDVKYTYDLNKEMQKRAELLGLPNSPFKESEE